MLGALLFGIECFRETSVNARLFLLGAFILVLVTECLNSAIETIVDRIGIEQHPLSKKAKDLGSAAVLITLVHFTIVWIISWFW
jgi:diacylglycerol kinase (ATP)